MDRPEFDLQSHSTYSDGSLGPTELVERAAAAGVTLLALTDHDSVDGVSEALEAATRVGITLSPAAELSTVHAGYEDLHILGYEIAIEHPALCEALLEFRLDRVRRSEKMADRLRELGLAVSSEALEARRREGKAIGRPHLAQATMNLKVNSELLAERNIHDLSGFFETYLVPGALAYVPRTHPTVDEAISLIHECGGVAVWAHPFWDIKTPESVEVTLRDFQIKGLDGVEVFYHSHTEEQTRFLHEMCSKEGLLITGSSDFHGPEHDHMNSFRDFELFGLEPRLGPIGS